MPYTSSPEPLLVQIPPATSPVLQPSRHARDDDSDDDDEFHLNLRNPDIPDDGLEFLAPGQWDDTNAHFTEGSDDDEGEDGSDDDDGALGEDDDIEDWSLEDGHIAGVPCANVRLDAKQYQTAAFLDQLLSLLRHDLAIPGWSSLPFDAPSSLIQVHKVSGSLTNAVFFVSIPETECEIETAGPSADELPAGGEATAGLATPVPSHAERLLPATVFSELERGRATATTPTPDSPPDSAPSTPQTAERALPPLPGALPLEAESTPSPSPSRRGSPASGARRTEKTLLSAPTLLLRVYGPQSGSLISRRTELHILHTLSSQYGIGAHVLGTFANGRVEEYFHSRALSKEEMRDPRVSRWIGRRMRELHSVELEQMVPPPRDEDEEEELRRRSRSRSEGPTPAGDRADSSERPGPEPLVNGGRSPVSGASIYSTSSSSSVFSFGSSSSSVYSRYSSSSARSSSTLGSGYARSIRSSSSLVSSPGLLPQRQASESRADEKKRPRRRGASGGSGRRTKRAKDKLCVWENITRWTREARLVLKELDQLAQIPGFDKLLAARSAASTPSGPSPTGNSAGEEAKHITPLSHPSLTLTLRSLLNLPLFEHQLRLYRSFVRRVERSSSLPPSSSAPPSSPPIGPVRSKRVFAHNDTQYGNLLLVTPQTTDPEEEREIEREAEREGGAHRRLIVVDFEYAGANPRGFDIANHFCEWQADYHHPSLSHSLSAHQPYPTRAERIRFLRAYVGCDGGLDSSASNASAAGEKEDPRVERLLEEVRVWEPSSHAMWAVWGIVQAKEDLMARIEVWRERAARVAPSYPASPTSASPPQSPPATGAAGLVDEVERMQLSAEDAQGMVDLAELDEVGEVFDYLSYAAERMEMFRRELSALGVI
ncbi:hypothetical protein JCM10213_009241 [Rhodosporidiobolus nylandii]